MTAPTNQVLTPECQLKACGLCRPGYVVTPSGDTALRIRCDCRCHITGRPQGWSQ